jgi:uncharacterized protein YfdQ (DUF2303 family)
LGVYLRGRKPPAKKWAFISRRLKYRVGGQNEEKLIVLELLDKAIVLELLALKFKNAYFIYIRDYLWSRCYFMAFGILI